jgi:tetratricopeptide (TPR) repeat protein
MGSRLLTGGAFLFCACCLLGGSENVAAREHFRLGEQAAAQKNFAVAAREFEAARSSDPNFPGIEKQLGLAFFQLRDYATALPSLQQASSRQIGDIQILLALGICLAKMDRPADAQAVFVDLLRKYPDSPQLHLLWGEAYASQGLDSEAEHEVRQAIQLSPTLAGAHFDLGVLEIHRRRWENARRNLLAELKIDHVDSRAFYHLAFVSLMEQKPDEALPLLRQAIHLKPDYAEAHYSLGKMMLDRNDYGAAITELRLAAKYGPNKPFTHYLLARAYLKATE